MEHRQGVELRADGRTLTGAAVRYGDVSPSHRERFVPGSLIVSPNLAPTLGHRSQRVLAYGEDVRVEDRADALIVSAHLPHTAVADRALAGVQSGRYRGWSVEFLAQRESRDAAGIRVIERAELPGLALVDHPSYPGSGVEARRKNIFQRIASVKKQRRMDCSCAGQGAGAGVDSILFDEDAFDEVLEAVSRGRNVSAIARGAGDVIADTETGSLTLEGARDGLRVGIEGLDTESGRRTAELVSAGVSVYARPIIDFDASDYTVEGNVARVSRASFAYILVKPTHRTEGLEPLERARARRSERRMVKPVRRRLWL